MSETIMNYSIKKNKSFTRGKRYFSCYSGGSNSSSSSKDGGGVFHI